MTDRVSIDDNAVAEDRKRQLKKEHDLKWEIYQLRQRVDILEEHINNIDKAITNILKTQLNEVMLVNSIAEDVVKLMKEDKK